MKLRSSFPLLALVLVACADDGVVTDKPSAAVEPTLPGYTGGNSTPITPRPVGGMDFAYGTNGAVTGTMRSPVAFASLADGTTYVAHGKAAYGTDSRAITVEKFNSLGKVETSFGPGTGVIDLPIQYANEISRIVAKTQADGRLTVAVSVNYNAGYVGGFALVARFLPSGTLDGSFGTSGIARFDRAYDTNIRALEVDANGEVYVSGSYNNQGQGELGFIGHLTAAGQRDFSFGQGGVVTTYNGSVNAFARQRGGGVLTLDNSGRLTQLAWNGAVDNRGYAVNRPLPIQPVAISNEADGTLFVVGQAQTNGALSSSWSVYRIAADGTVDPAFGIGGVATLQAGAIGDNSYPTSIVSDDRGFLFVGGTVQRRGATTQFNSFYSSAAVVRLNRAGVVDTTFAQAGWLFPATASDDKAVCFLATTQSGNLLVGSALGVSASFATRANAADRFDLVSYFR